MAEVTLRIRLLGELDLRHGEVPVPPLGSARAESLLATCCTTCAGPAGRGLAALSEAVDVYGGARAIGCAERALHEDPLREATYRLLMRLHDARGDRARALRAYHACATTLERELNVEPSAATRRAYEALLPAGAG